LQVNAMQLAMRWQLLADGLVTRAPKEQRAKPRRRSSLINDSFLQERPASEPLSHPGKKWLARPTRAPRRRTAAQRRAALVLRALGPAVVRRCGSSARGLTCSVGGGGWQEAISHAMTGADSPGGTPKSAGSPIRDRQRMEQQRELQKTGAQSYTSLGI